MRAGELRHSIEIHTPTQTTGNAGGVTETFAKLCVTWAAIEPAGGREVAASAGAVSLGQSKIRTRYIAGVTTLCIILWGTKKYEINSIKNPREQNRELEFICTEVK